MARTSGVLAAHSFEACLMHDYDITLAEAYKIAGLDAWNRMTR
jgi:hypothetical protein